MTLETVLCLWAICSFIVAMGLGAYTFLLKFNDERLPRWQRIVMVFLGPITLFIIILILFPPTRLILYTLWDVLIKK